MSINYVLIFTIILIVAVAIAGYRLGTIRMVFLCIALSISVFIAGIIDSGVYKALDFIGFDKAIYSVTGKTVLSAVGSDDYAIATEYINNHVNAQAEYIENLHVPYDIKLSVLENNNSKIYEYLSADSFVEYIGRFSTYIILCAISFVISMIISVVFVNLVFKHIGINDYVASEKSPGKCGGALLGLIIGFIIIYVMLAAVSVLSDTGAGVYLYNQIKASRILNCLYENNIVIKFFLLAKAPIWIAEK